MQFHYTMPGYFPHFEDLPAITRTTNALVRGQITNNIGPQSIRMNQAIVEQKKMLVFNEGRTSPPHIYRERNGLIFKL
jgi:hypothetical protein